MRKFFQFFGTTTISSGCVANRETSPQDTFQHRTCLTRLNLPSRDGTLSPPQFLCKRGLRLPYKARTAGADAQRALESRSFNATWLSKFDAPRNLRAAT